VVQFNRDPMHRLVERKPMLFSKYEG